IKSPLLCQLSYAFARDFRAIALSVDFLQSTTPALADKGERATWEEAALGETEAGWNRIFGSGIIRAFHARAVSQGFGQPMSVPADRSDASEPRKHGTSWLSWRRLIKLGLLAICLIALAEVARIFVGSNFHTVLAGKLYRGAQPSASDLESMVQRYGIKTVVN